MASNKLGIIAGNGDLPRLLVEACLDQNRPFFVIAFEGITSSEIYQHHPHILAQFGALGSTLSVLRDEGVDTLVMAGGMKRPKLSALKPDAKAAKLISRLGMGLFAGDDTLLKTITQFLEEEGFRIVGADDVLGDVRMPAGVLGSHSPTVGDLSDIARAAKVARAIGALDVGQAVIVQQGHVLGVEAMEGTDALIERCGLLRLDEPGGVLVKVKKPTQDRRADLPSMGVETVRRVKAAGLAGIAMEAGQSLLLDKDSVVNAANEAGIFVYGVELTS
jgi:DUF1009 family protein